MNREVENNYVTQTGTIFLIKYVTRLLQISRTGSTECSTIDCIQWYVFVYLITTTFIPEK